MSPSEQFMPAFLEEVVGDRFGRYSNILFRIEPFRMSGMG